MSHNFICWGIHANFKPQMQIIPNYPIKQAFQI